MRFFDKTRLFKNTVPVFRISKHSAALLYFLDAISGNKTPHIKKNCLYMAILTEKPPYDSQTKIFHQHLFRSFEQKVSLKGKR